MILEQINNNLEIKKLTQNELTVLCKEIRDALLHKLSVYGGHFGSNFGIVEATVALHYVFNSPIDKIIFDVSHQSYVHKMITGRKDAFLLRECYSNVTGYSAPLESEHDVFTMGHTSTSISLATGIAKARDLKGEKYNVIAVIGDGSLSGGEALEALNFAGEFKGGLIIVVNDNDMSIAENHGGIYRTLKELRDSQGKAENNLFKAMGIDYRFVGDGNNIPLLIDAFESVKGIDHPVVLHIVTKKGKGYKYAEENKEEWHYATPFDIETGKRKYERVGNGSYGDITARFLLEKMKKDKDVVAITAGTPTVFGFNKERRDEAGDQFIDVGIAEEHALALSSGIAKAGGKPVWGVNSTFMQRTFDQMSHDVCLNSSPVTILVFSSSIYGMSDVTHLGIYDIPMISNIPNLVYLSPTCKEEYLSMIEWSLDQNKYPVAIRVPGSKVTESGGHVRHDYSDLNKFDLTYKGSKIAIIAQGTFFELGKNTKDELKEKYGIDATLINPLYLTGVDTELLESLKADHSVVVTIEDGIVDGGFGEKITRFYGDSDMKVLNYGFAKEFPMKYELNDFLNKNRLNSEMIAKDAVELVK